jgi:formate hydrogenlyase subunit 6/NADH:ubiquinone oxidoreductase subunit I
MRDGYEFKKQFTHSLQSFSEEIIAPLCTICGACEVACPVDALKLKGQTVQHYTTAPQILLSDRFATKFVPAQKPFC